MTVATGAHASRLNLGFGSGFGQKDPRGGRTLPYRGVSVLARPFVSCIIFLFATAAQAQEVRVLVEGVADVQSTTRASPQANGEIAVDSGTVDAVAGRIPNSGRTVRWESHKGAFLVWTFRATVTHTGATARFELRAAETQGRELRYAVGKDTKWTRPEAGLPLSVATSAIVASGLMSGEAVVFQIAMPVLNSDRPGTFSPNIQYAAYINGASSAPDPSIANLRRMLPTQRGALPPAAAPMPRQGLP